uniref:Pre-mRNA-processing factor 6 n=1 Tax=Rhabditophanes sp. KR3021 TaxID=114890 RepID=A0AC35TWC6_9BILA
MATFIPGSLVDKNRKHFLNQPAPAGYVAGIGRGDFGFTTRSDIGPARAAVPGEEAKAGASAPKKAKEDEEKETASYNDSNYDEFDGYKGSLFDKDPYEKDDEEADIIYNAIDNRLDERRKDIREKKKSQEMENFFKARPKLQHEFSDSKRDLANVTLEEWAAIPEVGDGRNKAKRNPRTDRITAAPDSLIAMSLSYSQTAGALSSSVQNEGFQSEVPGIQTTDLDLVQMGQAKNRLMDIRLNQASDSVTGQTVIDPTGYITGLQSNVPAVGADINDIKKFRKLLKSVRDTNPKHTPAWIASARLEENAGKSQAGRNLIMEGVEKNPKSEEIWMEAIRMHPPETAKKIVANAVSHLPHSVAIWMKAASMEAETKAKRKVIRKALENVPTSVVLWKGAVQLEESEEARQLLARAVECCPTSTELWLALAKLETYDNARKVLNKAREHVPTERLIWISAAKLEESNQSLERIQLIVDRALTVLRANMVEINRSQWMKDAIDCEKSGCPHTSKAIITAILPLNVEELDKREMWFEDAEHFKKEEAFACARAVYSILLEAFPTKKKVWLTVVNFEREHGTPETYLNILKAAVDKVPQVEVIWLMYAKCSWQNVSIDSARDILSLAFRSNADSVEIWLAAVKLESVVGENAKARKLLSKARDKTESPRIWMKSARLEWCMGELAVAKKLLVQAIEKFPDFPKLYMMLGQIYQQEENIEEARAIYSNGIKKNPESHTLWILLSRLDESQNSIVVARSILEKARLKIPNNPYIWLESIRLEARAGFKELANERLSRALQCCESDGIIWAEAIWMEDRHGKNSKLQDAFSKCEHDADVVLSAAKMFWSKRRIDKARNWFQRALKINSDHGDCWAYYYKFELLHGTLEEGRLVYDKCIKCEPCHGETWQKISKDVKNWNLKTADILTLVASELEIPK